MLQRFTLKRGPGAGWELIDKEGGVVRVQDEGGSPSRRRAGEHRQRGDGSHSQGGRGVRGGAHLPPIRGSASLARLIVRMSTAKLARI